MPETEGLVVEGEAGEAGALGGAHTQGAPSTAKVDGERGGESGQGEDGHPVFENEAAEHKGGGAGLLGGGGDAGDGFGLAEFLEVGDEGYDLAVGGGVEAGFAEPIRDCLALGLGISGDLLGRLFGVGNA